LFLRTPSSLWSLASTAPLHKMMRCRRGWLLAPCIVSVLLLAPIVYEGLFFGASDMSPPALTPPFIKQADERVSVAFRLFHYTR
uniref:Uncharacterized protein n=1 Tax=Aegilops tauschii subsp. strangulata TaxID=200361 RepID=A0A453J5D2_AEGTS